MDLSLMMFFAFRALFLFGSGSFDLEILNPFLFSANVKSARDA